MATWRFQNKELKITFHGDLVMKVLKHFIMLLGLISFPSISAPILLDEIAFSGGQSSRLSVNPAFGILPIYYDSRIQWPELESGLGGVGQVIDVPDICLGCNLYLLSGQTGTFIFDGSTPDFIEFAEKLTNGIDEPFARWRYILDSSLHIAMGGGGASLESAYFGTATDFVGYRLDHITLVVSEFQIEENDVGETVVYSDARWEFWGENAIDEPVTFVLLAVGFGSLGILQRRRHKRIR